MSHLWKEYKMFKPKKFIVSDSKVQIDDIRLCLGILLWFSTAIILGIFLEDYLSFSFIKENYHGYINLIKHKDKFSSAVFALLILSPFFTFYFYRYCIRPIENIRLGHYLLMIGFALSAAAFNTPYLESHTLITTRRMRYLFGLGDWIGAFLFCAMSVCGLIIALSMLVKYLLHERQKKKNFG